MSEKLPSMIFQESIDTFEWKWLELQGQLRDAKDKDDKVAIAEIEQRKSELLTKMERYRDEVAEGLAKIKAELAEITEQGGSR